MKLEKYIEETGIKKNFLCKKIGITPATLSNILAGLYSPSLKIAVAVDKYTEGKVSVYDWLLTENDNNSGKVNQRQTRKTKKDKAVTE